MRLFVAIDIPDAVKDHLAFLQRSLDGVSRLRLSHPKNIHLTLNFLGEQKAAEIIIKDLSALKFSPFSLRLSSVGFFPSRDQPRVLWVGLEDSKELMQLQGSIDRLFTPKKSFKPHLTLARIKPGINEGQLLKTADSLEVKSLSFKVTSFKLYKSTLTQMGPIYEVLETFKASQ